MENFIIRNFFWLGCPKVLDTFRSSPVVCWSESAELGVWVGSVKACGVEAWYALILFN
ncbi:hypothetical protein NTGHW29_730016 [Candidatus Nitrotoga sp. HW29]|nr:hypothetical protein NTGHW29_730016 [Candidatus Nitrotoga sp. HW29]